MLCCAVLAAASAPWLTVATRAQGQTL
eukprot:COSAG01_NODE_17507_length_1145_cov_1.205545_1_plen_26_part_01